MRKINNVQNVDFRWYHDEMFISCRLREFSSFWWFEASLSVLTWTVVSADTGFGTTGGFGTSAFGTTSNTGGLFGSTQNKPGSSALVSFVLVSKTAAGCWCDLVLISCYRPPVVWDSSAESRLNLEKQHSVFIPDMFEQNVQKSSGLLQLSARLKQGLRVLCLLLLFVTWNCSCTVVFDLNLGFILF